MEIYKHSFNRRSVLLGGAALLATPAILSRPSRANSGTVVVRSSGGAVEENNRKHIWNSFEQQTGIRVVPVPANVSKLFAMVKSGNIELDVVDVGAGPILNLERQEALAPVEFNKWTLTSPEDISPVFRGTHWVGHSLFSTVMGYNTELMPDGKQPKTWEQFWDSKNFPGPRALMDLSTGNPNLEFALMADGVPKDQIYPIDLNRAFASLTRIRDNVPKFWDSGALSVQMLLDKEVAAASIWSSRASPAIAQGGKMGIEWVGNLTQIQSFSVFKDAPNFENAQRYIEYALQPEIQAAVVQQTGGGATNAKSGKFLPAGYADNAPGGARRLDEGLMMNDVWWEDNREAVNRAWSRWLRR